MLHSAISMFFYLHVTCKCGWHISLLVIADEKKFFALWIDRYFVNFIEAPEGRLKEMVGRQLVASRIRILQHTVGNFHHSSVESVDVRSQLFWFTPFFHVVPKISLDFYLKSLIWLAKLTFPRWQSASAPFVCEFHQLNWKKIIIKYTSFNCNWERCISVHLPFSLLFS